MDGILSILQKSQKHKYCDSSILFQNLSYRYSHGSKNDFYGQIFVIALIVITKDWKQVECP